tara:strand:- start:241 stop:375 length:135 start_codon:yes stop_codon:yes gene_type:complete
MKNIEIINNISSKKKILKTKAMGNKIIKYLINLSLFVNAIFIKK